MPLNMHMDYTLSQNFIVLQNDIYIYIYIYNVIYNVIIISIYVHVYITYMLYSNIRIKKRYTVDFSLF